MPELTQQNRAVAVETSLGEDILVLRSFNASEQLGRLFQFDLELLSEDGNIQFDSIIGENLTVRLELAGDEPRYFNGYVSRFVQHAAEGGFARYQATVVPWLWFLTRTADCRIFQNKTVPAILEEVFRGHGFDGKYELKLEGNYREWEYCVQYRETDFNFVSRLMEQEGIYYFFKHENGKHTLVLADRPSAHETFAGYETIRYRPPGAHDATPEHIRDWVIDKELLTGAYAHNDFNFTKPKTSLQARSNVAREHAAADFEVFDYPGEYEEPDEGTDYAQIRIEEIQARHETLHGQTDSRGICPGSKFSLEEFPREDQNREYLVVSANYSIHSDDFTSGGGNGPLCNCSFSVIDATVQFRPARITPKPIIQGPQTAIVVGPKGEEIHTEEHGRVKVQFHWDRYGKADENSSCWVRVSQAWAGKKWGAFYLPRIGQEVIVEFLEGDPDWPIITGRVYNGEAKPPYDLPDHKTISTNKSNTTKGGAGFNEIRFEDKKGEEQIFMHGEKNLDVRIKNDTYEFVGNDRHLIVKKDQIEHVENNRNETVDADHMEKIGKDRHLKVTGKEAKEVGKSLSLTVKGDVIEVFKKNHSEQTTNDYYLKADNIVIEAMTNVTIKVGQSYIAIEAGGIKIATTGTLELEASATASIKAQAPLTIESQATAEVKSPMTTIKGDGMLTLKGGMVMIN